jgi:hypothetical protein
MWQGCSPAQTVVALGGSDPTITFGGISIPVSGSYTLAVSYNAGNNPNPVVQLSVDGTNTTVTFPQPDECNGTVSVPVTLQTGNNTVTFTYTSRHLGDGPLLDHIVISHS